MAHENEFLDYAGLQNVAGQVNSRLKTVSNMPAGASNGAIRLYVGPTTSSYTKGHTYQYDFGPSTLYGCYRQEMEGTYYYAYSLGTGTPSVGDTFYVTMTTPLTPSSNPPTNTWEVTAYDASTQTVQLHGDPDEEYTRYSEGDVTLAGPGTWTDITPTSSVTVDQTYNAASTNAQSGTAVAQAIAFKYTDTHTYYTVQNMQRPIAFSSLRFAIYFGVDYNTLPPYTAVLIRGTIMPASGTPQPFYWCAVYNSVQWIEVNDSHFLASSYVTITKNLTFNDFSVLVEQKSGVSGDVYFAGTIELTFAED